MDLGCRRLVGKTVVVIAGASEIGEAAVHRFLLEGANVVIGDPDRVEAEQVANRVQQAGLLEKFGYYPCDVLEEQDVVRLLRYTIQRFGRLDCFVNNKTVRESVRSFLDLEFQEWDRTHQVNLRGAFLGTKHAAQILIKQGQGGSIINVASLSGLSGGNTEAAYAASHAGILAMTRSAATQLGRHRIRCNAIVHGAIISPPQCRTVDPDGPDGIALTMQPLPVGGDAKMIAPAFAFLASDDAQFMTGHSLIVDGGVTSSGQDLYSGIHPWGNAIMERAIRLGVGSFDHGARAQANQSTSRSSILDEFLGRTQETNGKRKLTILITGASKGLGYELCRGFVRLGHTVIGCARNPEMVERLQQEFGPPHSFRAVDIADDAQVARWAEAALAEVGVPDLLLNNAAVTHDPKQIWRISNAEFEIVMRVNVLGTVNVIRHFLPAMIQRMSGIVVNFSSGWGRDVSAKGTPYCASKWAIEGLTKAMAQELPSKMAVVSLHPGIIRTETMKVTFGEAAQLYPTPDEWAKVSVPYLLSIRPEDNGRQLSVPGMTMFRGMGRLPKVETKASPATTHANSRLDERIA